MLQTQTHHTESSIVIVGVGLIGGSIAAAVRQRFPLCRVVGIGRSAERLQQAQEMGLLTSWSVKISAESIPDNSLAVVCLPVDQIAEAIEMLRKTGCSLITDAGSVKSSIYNAIHADSEERYVGSHPIAGSELSGFENSDANLFRNRLCVVTTRNQESLESAPALVKRVADFWSSLGSRVHLMSPDEHDRILALTSHLPHILSSVTAACVGPDLMAFTGTGYRDTTRIAAGNASLWASILLANEKHCVDSIRLAERHLQNFRDALMSGNREALEALWESAATQRRQLDSRRAAEIQAKNLASQSNNSIQPAEESGL